MTEEIPKPDVDQEELKEEIKFKIELIERRIKGFSEAIDRIKNDVNVLLPSEKARLVLDANQELGALPKLLESLIKDIRELS